MEASPLDLTWQYCVLRSPDALACTSTMAQLCNGFGTEWRGEGDVFAI